MESRISFLMMGRADEGWLRTGESGGLLPLVQPTRMSRRVRGHDPTLQPSCVNPLGEIAVTRSKAAGNESLGNALGQQVSDIVTVGIELTDME
jgi:hypothetical protein